MTRTRRPQAGFTMLEVVLAMTLLAMVTGMIYAAFHLGIRAVEKGQTAVVSAQRARAANDIMRRQLKSMFPYPCLADPDDTSSLQPFFTFVENPPKLEFVTSAGLHGGGGLEFVRYDVRGNPPALYITATPMIGFELDECGAIELRGAAEAVLLDGFRSFEFEPGVYEQDESWKKDGGAENFGMPRSIRVRISGLAGSATTAEGADWTIPIVANLESQDGFRIFEQWFEEGAGIEVGGATNTDQDDGNSGGSGNGGGAGGDDSGDVHDPDVGDDD